MIPEMDRERQFNDILDAAESDSEALLAAARQIERHDTEISADLHLLAQLLNVSPTRAEIDSARLRVGQRLTRDIFAGNGDQDSQKHALRPLRLSEPPDIIPTPDDPASARPLSADAPRATILPRRLPSMRRIIIGTVAAATLLLALGAGLTAASAQSLPESPLYSVKRAEETLLLAFPLNDSARAWALSMVAQRRLAEAQHEAINGNNAEATTLLSQYNDDMRSLIMLAAVVNARHGDSSAITTQILMLLQTQQTIQQSSIARSDSSFSRALNDSAATISATLLEQNVTLPNTKGSAGQNNGKGHGGATTPTPTIGPTPTVPGSSGTHSHGHGNGNNNDGNSGSDH